MGTKGRGDAHQAFGGKASDPIIGMLHAVHSEPCGAQWVGCWRSPRELGSKCFASYHPAGVLLPHAVFAGQGVWTFADGLSHFRGTYKAGQRVEGQLVMFDAQSKKPAHTYTGR